MGTMKRQLVSAALGLMMAFSAIGPAAAQQEIERLVVLNGCVVLAEDGSLVVTTGGTGRGPNGGAHNRETYHVQVPEGSPLAGTIQNGCGMIMVYQQDGVWYVWSAKVTADGSGVVEYEMTQGSGNGEGQVTIEEEHQGTVERPVGPRGNR
jgi:hypothetical protein